MESNNFILVSHKRFDLYLNVLVTTLSHCHYNVIDWYIFSLSILRFKFYETHINNLLWFESNILSS